MIKNVIAVPILLFIVGVSLSIAAGGDLIWEDQTNATVSANVIAVSDNRVFVAGSGWSGDLLVRAYDTEQGYLLWEFRDEEISLSAMSADKNGIFVVGSIRKTMNYFCVLALNKLNGNLIWKDMVESGLLWPFSNDITADAGRVFATGHGTSNSFTRAYDSITGRTLWVADTHSGKVAAANGAVHVAGEGLVSTFAAQTGEPIWQDEYCLIQNDCEGSIRDIEVKGSRLFVVGQINRQFAICTYEAGTGAILWEDRIPNEGAIKWFEDNFESGGLANAVTADNIQVFVAGEYGGLRSWLPSEIVVRGYDAKTGNLLWQDFFDGDTDSQDWERQSNSASDITKTGNIVVIGGAINFSEYDSESYTSKYSDFILRAYNSANGNLTWQDIVVGTKIGCPYCSYEYLVAEANAVGTSGGLVFAAGTITDGTDFNFLVRAYDTGTEIPPTAVRNPVNDHWYQRYDDTMNWHDAKAHCESMSGYLATLTSQSEHTIVYNNLGVDAPYEMIWLGATDEAQEGIWQWVTGEPWDFSFWDDGEPNNCIGTEHYLVYFTPNDPLGRAGSWNDLGEGNNGGCGCGECINEWYPMSIICEWDGPTQGKEIACQSDNRYARAEDGGDNNGDNISRSSTKDNFAKWELIADGRYHRIRLSGTPLYLSGEGPAGSIPNGRNIHLWNWADSDLQRWELIPDGLYYRLRCAEDDIYLSGSGEESNIHLWQWAGSDLQRWDIQDYYPTLENCEGDFNSNGLVNENDLSVFVVDFGRADCTGYPDCPGDFNTDNDVDGMNLSMFIADYGRIDCP